MTTREQEIRAEMLLISAAIEKILTHGQAASIHGKAVTFADLRALFSRQDELRGQLARMGGPLKGRLV